MITEALDLLSEAAKKYENYFSERDLYFDYKQLRPGIHYKNAIAISRKKVNTFREGEIITTYLYLMDNLKLSISGNDVKIGVSISLLLENCDCVIECAKDALCFFDENIANFKGLFEDSKHER